MTSVISNSTHKTSNNLAYNTSAKNRQPKSPMIFDHNHPTSQQKQRTKLIVDKDIGHTTMEGIHESIVAALQNATSNTIIKIASDLYEE
jgi:hypothetical protein